MLCPSCQNDAPVGSKFCNGCGARLDAACPQCGRGNPPGSRFCTECGYGLTAPSPSARVAQSPSPQTYTPQHLAERILTSRAALEGERKQVTVLFADLKGSMELLADRDPEEARRLLDPVLERMMEAVHRYEGTVNQVMGDGIMALFGAPLAHEDHAVRACYAAMSMQESVKQYADEVRRQDGVLAQIRVGLNSGEVVVRSVGSDLRMDYTAVGQTTHLAARMEQMAMPGTILLAPATLQLAEGYVHVRPLGPVQVKGLDDTVEVYELIGAETARSRLQAAATRGLTRFVGRDAELETLRRTLEQAGSGHGQVVALVGEPGVGKSRLVWEFSHSHRTQGWLLLESGSVSYGKANSYLPVIDLLKIYCGIESRDDHRRMREKVLGKLLNLDRALEPTLPALLGLLDVPVDDPAWTALDPPQRRQRTLDVVKRLILRESQEQPLLLVFEDLHWIDAETHALLDSLVESLPTTRILLLVTYRPEYEHTWHRKTYYQQLRLDPLQPESADELLAALLGDSVELQPLKRMLIERTEGNPFFVEESVRALVESSVLAGERGCYRLAKPVESTQVPATVQAVLAARIDRLMPEDKWLLQSAAVIGKDVPYPLLQAIAELPEAALRQGLARLQAAELLYETSLFPDLEYTFKHALTHEVTYGSLLHERRRTLHARIVAVIETLYQGRQTEQVERLAQQATLGEVWDKATTYGQQAGDKAAGRSAHREAVAYYEQALAAIGHLPQTPDVLRRAIGLRFALRTSLQPILGHQRIVDLLREAQTLAEELNDQRLLGQTYAYLGAHFTQSNNNVQGIEVSRQAVAVAEAVEDFGLLVQARHYLGNAYGVAGDYRRATELLRCNVEALTGDRAYQPFGMPWLLAVGSRTQLARALAELGEFTEALAHGQAAVEIAEKAGLPFSLVVACDGIGCALGRKGELAQAIRYLERSLAICQTGGFAAWLHFIASDLSYVYSLSGRAAEALPLLEQAIERMTALTGAPHAHSVVELARAYVSLGRPSDGAITAARALDLSRPHELRGQQAHALLLRGSSAMQRADSLESQEAETYYRQALALANELGMRPLAAHCHLGLGTLYQKAGRHAEGQAELTTAAEMYRAMEMAFWLERAETALANAAG
jgi:class 3 adenylate cyclase/tetratricopeptide (TPR) repeat protein